jgi:SAM-dependent MidA family methyltransferase
LAARSTNGVGSGAEFDSVEQLLAARIRRHGPLPYDDVVEAALYDPVHGFYQRGGAAGRRHGDFITSPEVGPLFGAVVARALDTWWRELGEPDPYVVVDAGAGVGTLARSVRVAEPACLPALTYLLVERSAALRAGHDSHLELAAPNFAFGPHVPHDLGDTDANVTGTGPRFVSLDTMPAVPFIGVIIANELLDNVPFQLAQRTEDGWREVRVGLSADDSTLVEVLVPPPDSMDLSLAQLAPAAPLSARVPIQSRAADWLRVAIGNVERGRVVVLDYASRTAELATRPARSWLRTYRGHERGAPPLEELGTQDITVEVCIDQLARVRRPAHDRSQADFLRAHGLAEFVDEGRRIWKERAAVGDLEAVRGRSRINEAEALSDPNGLGAFQVVEWTV